MPNAGRPLWDLKQLAAFMGVSPRTCRDWIDRGLLPARRIGPRLLRLTEEDIEQFLASSRLIEAGAGEGWPPRRIRPGSRELEDGR